MAVALIASTVIWSCVADDGTTGPSARRTAARPIVAAVQGDEELFANSFRPANSNQVIGPFALPPLPYKTAVLIYATGLLQEQTHPGAPNYPLHAPFDAGGWSPNGSSCYANVAVGWPNGSSAFCAGQINPPAAYVYAQGQGTATWQNTWGNAACGPQASIPCWDYEGGFDVSITRLAAAASLRASKSVVALNTTVTFTVTISPSTFGPANLQMPLEVTRWYWVSDGSTTEVSPGCSNGVVCSYTPTQSGNMWVEAVENGKAAVKGRRVQVTPCPPVGDSIVDNPDLRKKLLGDLAASRPSSAGRREYAFNIYCFENGTSNPQLPAGATRTGNGHTHPSLDGEPYPPGTCAGRGLPTPFENGGGSSADWAAPGRTGVPEYIPAFGDNNDYLLSRLDANVGRDQWSNNRNMWKIKKSDPNACPRPK